MGLFKMKIVIVFYTLWLVSEAATRSYPFTRRFTDYYCASAINNDFPEASMSSTQCVSACQNQPGCVGVFYSSGDSLCHGVGYYYGATTGGCEWRPGYAFYQSGAYSDMCYTSSHCLEYQTECKYDNCDCTYRYIRDGTSCRIRRYGDPCDSNYQCPEDGTECKYSYCDCITVNIRDGGVCRIRRYGDPCDSDYQCPEDGTECKYSYCDCITVNIRDGGVCRIRQHGDMCTIDDNCPDWEELACYEDACECFPLLDYVEDDGECVPAWYCYGYTQWETADINLAVLVNPDRDREICEDHGHTWVGGGSRPGYCNGCDCCFTLV